MPDPGSLVVLQRRNRADREMSPNYTSSSHVPFEANYPGVSPQLLARTRQMWSSRGLDLDKVWRNTIGRFRGVGQVSCQVSEGSSSPVDQFFMFEQAAIWVATLNASAGLAVNMPATRLTTSQWRALHALTYRMVEQLDAIRLLFLSELPTPSKQIARSISEDIDMAMAFISRPKLAARFINCTTIEEANEFWRRHIAGGRAFKAVSQQLYRAGLEFDQGGEYAAWRKDVKAILGTAVHSSFHVPAPKGSEVQTGQFHATRDCLYYVTLRLQEMCAYSHGLTKDFGEDLKAIHQDVSFASEAHLGRLTARISEITVDQLRWTLTNGDVRDAPLSHQVH